MNKVEGTIIGLDVGTKRIGVARIQTFVQIAEPLSEIQVDDGNVDNEIKALVKEHSADAIVVGLPRGLDGQDTQQTNYSREFATRLAGEVSVPVYLIDEAGTSKAAEERITDKQNVSIDSMAAAIFIEDFINVSNQDELMVRVNE